MAIIFFQHHNLFKKQTIIRISKLKYQNTHEKIDYIICADMDNELFHFLSHAQNNTVNLQVKETNGHQYRLQLFQLIIQSVYYCMMRRESNCTYSNAGNST